MLIDIVVTFVAAFAVDILYVLWVSAVSDERPLRSATYAIAIGACGLIGLLQAFDNRWLSIPYLLGLGCGTYVGVKMKMGLHRG